MILWIREIGFCWHFFGADRRRYPRVGEKRLL